MILIKKCGKRKCKSGNSYFSLGLFKCFYCGKEVEKPLFQGKKYKSCGCKRRYFVSKSKITHGEAGSRLYKIWRDMQTRCLNPNFLQYKDYGGRGIRIDNKWLDKKTGFINFKMWALNNGYGADLEIDRIDNNGNYAPDNCRFTTCKVNAQNQRTTKLNLSKVAEIREKYLGGKYKYKQLSEEYSVCYDSIRKIINNRSWK